MSWRVEGRWREAVATGGFGFFGGISLLSIVFLSCNHGGLQRAGEGAPAVVSDACPVSEGDPAQAYEAGRRRMERGRMGELVRTVDRDAALALYLVAARAGHPMAQFRFGLRVFSDHFQERGPDPNSPADRASYVQAMKWIAVAAARGLPRAKRVWPPWFLHALLKPEQKTAPPDPDDPLTAVPRAWLRQAGRQAAALRTCWPPVTEAEMAIP